MKRHAPRVRAAFAAFVVLLASISVFAAESWDGTLVQYGTMREAVGMQNHQGRVALNTLVERPHFFGVAALERLEGEITIFDSDLTVTGVTPEGTLEAVKEQDLQATLLVGAYVPAWTEHKFDHAVPATGFDDAIRDAAKQAGIDVEKPFVFAIDGELDDVKFHVINGACPMHARLKQIDLPAEQTPFEGNYPSVRGRLVGIYATDAVGTLTHPATSTHVHIIFEDATGVTATGHIEQVGLGAGAVLKLPTRG